MHPLRLIISVALVLAHATDLGVLAPGRTAAQTGIIYVRAGAAAPGDGATWASAYPSLQTALQAASSGAELWVAAGRYMPAPPNGDRAATFQLKDGVAVYGGFAGTETARNERDWTANLVTLSGDLNGDDGPDFADNDENSYHVVIGASGATLDGVTISGGNADDYTSTGRDKNGGGIYNDDSDPRLANVTFTDNSAMSSGGGMYNQRSSAPTLTNVTFSGNSAAGGGGMYNVASSPTLTNVTLSDNRAMSGGGGMYNQGSDPTLISVTLTGNTATSGDGGGMVSLGGSPTLTNVTFSGNSARLFGGGMYNSTSNPALINVTFSGNSAAGGGAMYNYGRSSPTLTNVIFSGNHAQSGGGIYNDRSNPTVTNATISGNSARSGGGMLNYGCSPQLRSSVIWGNSAPTGPAIFDDGSTPNVSFSIVEGGYPGIGNLDTNPLFATPIDPAAAPTTAGDLRLRAESPAIDAGNDDFLNPALPATDRDGNPRRVDGDLDGTVRVDMGAYERGLNRALLPLVTR
jgi:Chlamydia polymorphic membrane protein (Chlamydia_PMP) repeat